MLWQVADPKNPKKERQNDELVTFDGPKDSVYLKAKDYVELDVGTGNVSSAQANGDLFCSDTMCCQLVIS